MPEACFRIRVAVAAPLYGHFDYLCERPLSAGVRVRVPFGRGERVGVVLGESDASTPVAELKPVLAVLDSAPILPPEQLSLLTWAASYYHARLGEVVMQALPLSLREGQALPDRRVPAVKLTEAGRALTETELRRAPRQLAVWQQLSDSQEPWPIEHFDKSDQAALRKLIAKGWVERTWLPPSAAVSRPVDQQPPRLNSEQKAALDQIEASLECFAPFLLEGVTGSGKTEVYLAVIGKVLAQGRQVLVLVPEIALTPQLVERFQRRLGNTVACLHSGMAAGARLNAWLDAAEGRVSVLIGTRSAVFTPMPRLGLIVVDEEHDDSLKQQEGFRYHARDVAIWRAHQCRIPIVLGSATPSLESLLNVQRGRYTHLTLWQRAGGAKLPAIRVLDMRRQAVRAGLSDLLIERMRAHLLDGGQVLLFLNRRGYAPVLMCHACGWVAECRHCDAYMTLHRGAGELKCHHCGAFERVPRCCPHCEAPLISAGQGTEQLDDVLRSIFPEFGIERIDRDTVNRRGALETKLRHIREGRAQIVIGTQMLAKGHDFPGMSLVGIVDADQGLFSSDFRASERLAQLVVQVAGRAGRAERAGEVLIQTYQPEHPLLQTLVLKGYPAFAQALLEERRMARLPPHYPAAMVRADSPKPEQAEVFLQEAAALLANFEGVTPLGPVSAPMARRAGRYRFQVFVQALSRPVLHAALDYLVAQLAERRTGRLRWSVDVDPVDMY